MKVEVRVLNCRGRYVRAADRKSAPPAVGSLEVRERRISGFSRTALTARLVDELDDERVDVLPMLTDVQLLWLDDKGMRLRGAEEEDGVQVIQVWDVKVVEC